METGGVKLNYKKYLNNFFLLVFLLVIAGCASNKTSKIDVKTAWQSGNYEVAAAGISAQASDSEGKKDELILRLEEGLILQAGGDFKGSKRAFNIADSLVEKYEQEARVKLGSEAKAIFTSQASLPYTGRSYDRIMLSTFKAFHAMQRLNDDSIDVVALKDEIIVELERTLMRQGNAVADNKKRIEKAEKEREDALNKSVGDDGKEIAAYDANKAMNDPKLTEATSEQLAEMDKYLIYKDYVNPFSVFLDGLYFAHNFESGSDRGRALKSFERLSSMVENQYVSADLEMAKQIEAQQYREESLTYVIFASGSAPDRDETKIEIPLYDESLSYIAASFPKLVYNDNYHKELSVKSVVDQSIVKSEDLCSVDALVSLDFKNSWPIVVSKTLLSTATKAIAAKQLEDLAEEKGGAWGRLGAQLLTSSYQSAMNKADVRTWTALPKQFSYARIKTPVDGNIIINVGLEEKVISVNPEKVNVVYVRSINNLLPSTYSQFHF